MVNLGVIVPDSTTPCRVLELGFQNTTRQLSFYREQSPTGRDWAKPSGSYSLSPFCVVEKIFIQQLVLTRNSNLPKERDSASYLVMYVYSTSDFRIT